MITIQLTEKQLDFLLEILNDHYDKGPPWEGWQSDELCELVDFFQSVQDSQGENIV
jgi:hypothetical protein